MGSSGWRGSCNDVGAQQNDQLSVWWMGGDGKSCRVGEVADK